ncbi:MAG: DEAD/DEAH box helicase [Pseudomonadales bacterium]|nr:DEAD/DEAH box helicase [Pseudomonadales bacterium]
MSDDTDLPAFDTLGLAQPILTALNEVGYERPSPIQAACIPPLLDGCDILGQAQTGTGKTAAFALPLLSKLFSNSESLDKHTRVLVLAPTRELAIQVAEACQTYAKHLGNIHVMPIYGGQSYSTQLRQLKRGAHIVVGTPGRVMDHMRRGSLDLDMLDTLVLDEADEMLRMGFIDDVEWVLEQIPGNTQIALFSATMPREIKKVANNYLTDPTVIKIAAKEATATTIRQRFLQINQGQKLDAMTRILETEDYDGVITFVRTKSATTELADKLTARGYAAEALNGDIPQERREKIVKQLKAGRIDILIATDVVARGLDVERISHVINYDIPYDTESYVHRIGRTGRAGREGDAILFVTHRERRMLKSIERATKKPIDLMQLPTADDVNQNRILKFKQRIQQTLATEDLSFYQQLIAEFETEAEVDPLRLAAALAFLSNDGQSLLIKDEPASKSRPFEQDEGRERQPRKAKVVKTEAQPLKDHPDITMLRYCLEVGYAHDVKPGNIVGAIANEADIESQYIGNIEIYDGFSTVDLPEGMPEDILQLLSKARVKNQPMNLHLLADSHVLSPDYQPPEVSRRRAPSGNSRKRSGNEGKKRRPRGKNFHQRR